MFVHLKLVIDIKHSNLGYQDNTGTTCTYDSRNEYLKLCDISKPGVAELKCIQGFEVCSKDANSMKYCEISFTDKQFNQFKAVNLCEYYIGQI